MTSCPPKPRRGIRDLRDETWMVREGIAEIERDRLAAANNCGDRRRYQLSQIPYLGTDGRPTEGEHPTRKIYEDDSEYTKLSKKGGHKSLLWWYPDFPVSDGYVPKERRLLRPKPVEWSVHPASLLPSKHEEWLQNRKLGPTVIPPRPRLDKCRLQAHLLPPATGAPKIFTTEWEPHLKAEPYIFDKIIKNGYVEPWHIESKKRRYFDSLFDRPHNEQEKLALRFFLETKARNDALRDRANRFDRLSKGQPSWTVREKLTERYRIFPNGYGRGVKAPASVVPKGKAHEGC